MSTWNPDSPYIAPLAFRLRESVEYRLTRGVQPVLLLRYPLRVNVIHPMWRPVLETLKSGRFILFHRMMAGLRKLDPDQTQTFLESLVFEGFLDMRGAPPMDEFPTVSVVINASEPEDLITCLKSLAQMVYPRERLEILAAGPVSDELARKVGETFPEVRVLQMPDRPSSAECRNRAAREATGEFLAFTDARCKVPHAWLQELLPAFQDEGLGAVGGGTDFFYEYSEFDRYMQFRSQMNRAEEFVRFSPAEPFIPIAAWNVLVRRSIFESVGGFQEALSPHGEADFFWRIQEAGYGLEYRPLGKVHQLPRDRFFSFLKRNYLSGRAEPVVQKRHPAKIKPFLVPVLESLLWLLVIMAFLLGTSFLLISALALFFVDAGIKYIRVRRRNLPIGPHHVLLTSLKADLKFLHYCTGFVSRHYLLVGVLMLNLLPVPAAVIFLAHLTAGTLDYSSRFPQTKLISFFIFFTMEQLSYQAGLWHGCIQERHFKPLRPQVILRRDLWTDELETPFQQGFTTSEKTKKAVSE
ncbi:MAG: glycosyltransferase [Thermodesulfobacteriota bacterium]